jgi:hypothetical protein
MIPGAADRNFTNRYAPGLVDGVDDGIGDMLRGEAGIVNIVRIEPFHRESTFGHLAHHCAELRHILADYADARRRFGRALNRRAGHREIALDEGEVDNMPAPLSDHLVIDRDHLGNFTHIHLNGLRRSTHRSSLFRDELAKAAARAGDGWSFCG